MSALKKHVYSRTLAGAAIGGLGGAASSLYRNRKEKDGKIRAGKAIHSGVSGAVLGGQLGFIVGANTGKKNTVSMGAGFIADLVGLPTILRISKPSVFTAKKGPRPKS